MIDKETQAAAETKVISEDKKDVKDNLSEIKATITRNINSAEKYYDENYKDKTNETRDRYYGIRYRNPEIPDWCSNMTFNQGFGIVNAEAPQNMAGLYQPNQFFSLTANDDKSEMGVKAIQKLMYTQIPNMNFFSNHYWGVLESLYTPAGWMFWGWKKSEKKKRTRTAVDGKIETKTHRKPISLPFCLSCSVDDILYDHEGYNNDDMLFAAYKYFVRVEDIRNNKERYNNPDEVSAFLAVIDAMSPETRPSRVLIHEYYTENDLGIMTENGFLLAWQDNPYDRIPFRPIVKYSVPREILGVSSMEASKEILDAEDDLLNATFDEMLLNIHKPTYFTGSFSDENLERYPGATIMLKPGQAVTEGTTQPMGNDWMNMSNKISKSLNKILGNLDQIDDGGVDTATQARFVQSRSNMARRAFIDYNRENYMKWALEFWIELIIDNMTPDEVVKAIGEKEAKRLNLVASELKLKDINYTISITGDNDDEDRMVYMQNLNNFVATVAQIEQLKAATPNGPIKWDLLIQGMVNKFNLPEGTYQEVKEESTDPNAGGQPSIEQEIAATAQAKGQTPEQLITEIAQRVNKQPEQVLADIQQAGSFSGYLKQMAEAEKAQPAQEAAV